MKEFKKGFKRLVEKLYVKKTVYRLKGKTFQKANKEWRRIVGEYKEECLKWKKQCYKILETDWVYTPKKKIRLSDHPLEICFLIRLMNTIDSDNLISGEAIFYDMHQMAELLREEKNINANELAEYFEMYIGIEEMAEEDFIRIFSL